MSRICHVPFGETWQCGCSFRNAQSFPPRPPPLHPPPPCKISRVLGTLLGTWHCPCSAHQPPSLLPHPYLRSARKRTALRFWFSPFLPSPSRADRSPLVEEENYARHSREWKLAAALLWVRIRSSLAAALGVRGSVFAPQCTHTLPPIIRSSRTSLCPPCSSLWSLGYNGPLGVFVFGVMCCKFYDLMCLNVNSAVYVWISERNLLTTVLLYLRFGLSVSCDCVPSFFF